ncbi:50S ribosomal protein L17 [Candidatus Saccharibacteria bacterium]|nr:50S ribosomal protein L17 [Candidatus Saccharibacteria bacterium]
MHRHGYKGRKFGRERDPRQALIKGLADALVLNESIETTLPKAKTLSSYTEKLITKAKVGDLHNRRLVINGLMTLEAAHKLIDQIAPQLSGRNSGHLRIQRTTVRRGDNVQMAKVLFVDEIKKTEIKKADSKNNEVKQPTKKPIENKATKPTPAAKKTGVKKQ